MRLKADQRVKEDLDLFLLALIRHGIATPYRMQMAAGISQGASLQSLKRMVERKLVRAAEEGPRRRMEFVLTPAGGRWLDRGCAALIEAEPNGDFDSVLRKSLLLAFLERDGRKAGDFLRGAAAGRRAREASSPVPDPEAEEMAETYSRIRHARTAAIMNAEADVLEAAATRLVRRANRKR